MNNLINLATETPLPKIGEVLYIAGIWAVCLFALFVIWSYRDRKWSK